MEPTTTRVKLQKNPLAMALCTDTETTERQQPVCRFGLNDLKSFEDVLFETLTTDANNVEVSTFLQVCYPPSHPLKV